MNSRRRGAIAGLVGIVVSTATLFPVAGESSVLWPSAPVLEFLLPNATSSHFALLLLPVFFAVNCGVWTMVAWLGLLVVTRSAA